MSAIQPICSLPEGVDLKRYLGSDIEHKLIAEAVKALLPLFPGSLAMLDGDKRPCGVWLGTEKGFYLAIRDGRLVVSGKWICGRSPVNAGVQYTPHGLWDPRAPDTSITISTQKSAEQVKQDIERRFLPNYLSVLARLLAKRDSEELYLKRSHNLACELAAIFGQSRPKEDAKEQRVDLLAQLNGEVEANDDSADFKIRSLPKAQALKLAAFLVELSKEVA